jgi:mono/diheme cytochrome c family protein
MSIKHALAAAVAAVFGATAVQSQDLTVGEQIYTNRCTVCHGATGAGDGLAAVLFAEVPRNLRLLAKENGGEFPLDAVLQSIDGRRVLSAHGGASPMPIWGEAFMVETLGDRLIDPKDSAMIVQGRLLSVARYIESLQVQ